MWRCQGVGAPFGPPQQDRHHHIRPGALHTTTNKRHPSQHSWQVRVCVCGWLRQVAVQRFSYPYFTLSVYGATSDVFLARSLFHRWLNNMHITPTTNPAPIAPPRPPIPANRYTHTNTIGGSSSGTMMASQTLPPPTRNMTPIHKMPLVQHAAVGHGVGAGVGVGGTGSVVCRPPPPPPPGRGVYRYDPHSNRYALCYPHNTYTDTNTRCGQTYRPRIV